jgi:hypothetical protein
MDTALFIILYLNDPSVTKKLEKRNKHNTRTEPMPFSRAQTVEVQRSKEIQSQ